MKCLQYQTTIHNKNRGDNLSTYFKSHKTFFIFNVQLIASQTFGFKVYLLNILCEVLRAPITVVNSAILHGLPIRG